jgi:hypothetical protein
MQTRHLFGTIATFVGGPLLLATLIEPAAPLRPDVPAGAAGAAPARAVARAAAPAVAASAAAVVAETVAASPVPLPGLADAAITRAGADAGSVSPSGYFRTLAHAGETDDAYAAALPESDFALTEAGLGAGIAARAGLDGGLAASDGFAALPGGNVDLMLLTGFSTGGPTGGNAGNSAGDPPAFGATDQVQLVSGVPEPASWLAFIAGLALIGFNLRDRSRLRNVVC